MNSIGRLFRIAGIACTLLPLAAWQSLRGGGATVPSVDLATDVRAMRHSGPGCVWLGRHGRRTLSLERMPESVRVDLEPIPVGS